MSRVHPIFPVQRLEEIRALEPYVRYDELEQWYQSLGRVPIDQESPDRAAASRSGQGYNVRFLSTITMASARLRAVDDSHLIFFRGRSPYPEEDSPRQDFPFLQDYELAWRETNPSRLDLIPVGVAIGRGTYEPAIISVESRKTPLYVITAERLALDAATAIKGARKPVPVTSS
jgi:hypothetical protein